MPKHDKKGKQSRKAKNAMRKELGESWVEAYIANHRMWGDEELDKMILLEPREYLDYAVMGVAEEANGTQRAVYDLNVLETMHACMYAYELPEYKNGKFADVVFALSEEHVNEAKEWVSYNTIRGSGYLGERAPLFIRALYGSNVRLAADFIE